MQTERTTNTTDWTKVAEIELHYKTTVKPSERPKVSCSADCYQLFLQSWNDNTLDYLEQFKIMLLNRAHKVLGIVEISTGGTTGTVADPKVILAAALRGAACGIILCHCHPSGSLEPSRSDELLTAKLVQGAAYMDLKIYDHIILTRDEYFSFADNGLL